jgi:hypothetical protein
MMRQDGTRAWETATRGVPEWRLNKRTYEIPYLMKLGKISREEALALVARHNGDQYEITAALFSRRCSSQ